MPSAADDLLRWWSLLPPAERDRAVDARGRLVPPDLVPGLREAGISLLGARVPEAPRGWAYHWPDQVLAFLEGQATTARDVPEPRGASDR